MVVVRDHLDILDALVEADAFTSLTGSSVNVHKVDVKMIEGGLVVEVGQDFSALNIELLLNCIQTLIPDGFQKRQMLTLQVTNRLQISLLGQCKTVKSRDITLIELVVLLKEESIILVDTQVDFFLKVEDRVDPIAVVHIHWINVLSLDYIVVDLCRLSDDLHALASVLVDDIV